MSFAAPTFTKLTVTQTSVDIFCTEVYPNRETNVESEGLDFIGGFNFYYRYIYETPSYSATLR